MSENVKTLIVIIFIVVASGTIGYVTNFLAVEYSGDDSVYRDKYNQLTNNKFITEKEMEKIRELEAAYINDSSAKSERRERFYSIVFIGQLLVGILGLGITLVIKIQSHIKATLFSLFTFFSFLIGSGSLLQSVTASLLFASIAVYVGKAKGVIKNK